MSIWRRPKKVCQNGSKCNANVSSFHGVYMKKRSARIFVREPPNKCINKKAFQKRMKWNQNPKHKTTSETRSVSGISDLHVQSQFKLFVYFRNISVRFHWHSGGISSMHCIVSNGHSISIAAKTKHHTHIILFIVFDEIGECSNFMPAYRFDHIYSINKSKYWMCSWNECGREWKI